MPSGFRYTLGAAAIVIAAVSGCQSATTSGVGFAQVAARPGAVQNPAAASSELAIANVRVVVKEVAPLTRHFHLLALPSAWNDVLVTLHSPTVSSPYSAVTHARTLLRTAFSGSPLAASVSFGALRPATDYVAQVFLRNPAGTIVTTRLAGSQRQTITLNAGPNTIDFTVSVNTDEATYETTVANSSNANNTTDVDTPWVSTMAGSGSAALADGSATTASFNEPAGIAIGSTGNIFVADHANHCIRKIDTSLSPTNAGYVTTFVGSGYFALPHHLSMDAADNLYVAGFSNDTVYHVSPSGTPTLIGGAAWSSGYVDGNLTDSRFDAPTGVLADGTGRVFVTDRYNHRIRLINRNLPTTDPGYVSTFAGGGTSNDSGSATGARFYEPDGMAYDGSRYLYVADKRNHRVRRIDFGLPPTDANYVTTVAGTGSASSTDGAKASATLNQPRGLVLDGKGGLFVTEFAGNRIRKINLNLPTTDANYVTTVAGTGTAGYLDGVGAGAMFNWIYGIARDTQGSLIIGDRRNHRVRKLSRSGFHFTKDDTVTLATGINASQPGVARVDVLLSGPAYGSPASPVLIKRFTSAMSGSWNSFVWNTAAANTADSANYQPTSLAPTLTGLSYLNGQLDFQSYNANNEIVGKASTPIRVYGKPSITLRVQ